MSLFVENLKKSYKKRGRNGEKPFSLNNIRFQLEQGRILALVGQNGAGKTTLIKCLLNLLHPDSGRIRMNDFTIEQLIMRGGLGYMPDYVKFPEMITLKEYVNDLMVLRGKKFSEYGENFEQLTEKLYMTKHLNKMLTQYSKGTAKKAAFVQAVLHQPELLILDEPTDGLDPVSRRVLLNELLRMKEMGSTIVITTHLLADLAMVADEIIVLQNGSIIQQVNCTEISGNLDDWYLETIFANGGMEEL